MPKELSQRQICALITLWTLPAAEVPNTHLTNVFKVSLDKPNRDVLEKKKLITVRQERKGGPVFITLTDAGRTEVRMVLEAEPPAGLGYGEAAAYALLRALRPMLAGRGAGADDSRNLPDLLGWPGGVGAGAAGTRAAGQAPPAQDMESRIRTAYGAVARRPGDQVSLARLREALGAADRAEVDEALIRLNRDRDVHIVAESNQKTLGDDERAAAVSIGNRDRHLISIGS